MNRLVFVPHLDLTNSTYLNCSNDMRIPNHLSNYKYLVFKTNAVVTSYYIKPSDNKERSLIFNYLRHYSAVVREYVNPSEYSYVLEVLAEDTPNPTHGLQEFLKLNHIEFKILQY